MIYTLDEGVDTGFKDKSLTIGLTVVPLLMLLLTVVGLNRHKAVSPPTTIIKPITADGATSGGAEVSTTNPPVAQSASTAPNASASTTTPGAATGSSAAGSQTSGSSPSTSSTSTSSSLQGGQGGGSGSGLVPLNLSVTIPPVNVQPDPNQKPLLTTDGTTITAN